MISPHPSVAFLPIVDPSFIVSFNTFYLSQTLVSIIEEPPSDMILKSTLTSIGHLAMLSESTEDSLHEECTKIMKCITELPFVDCAVPRALLTAIIESNKSSIKALSLRALATVCVTGDAVKQFEEVCFCFFSFCTSLYTRVRSLKC